MPILGTLQPLKPCTQVFQQPHRYIRVGQVLIQASLLVPQGRRWSGANGRSKRIPITLQTEQPTSKIHAACADSNENTTASAEPTTHNQDTHATPDCGTWGHPCYQPASEEEYRQHDVPDACSKLNINDAQPPDDRNQNS